MDAQKHRSPSNRLDILEQSFATQKAGWLTTKKWAKATTLWQKEIDVQVELAAEWIDDDLERKWVQRKRIKVLEEKVESQQRQIDDLKAMVV